jgi:hypothetical protein
MTEEELRNRWLTHILHFTDWSKEKDNRENNNNLENKEAVA